MVNRYESVNKDIFAVKLKQIRSDYDITQEDFAKSLGASRAYILRLEQGAAAPTVMICKLISLMYNINYNWLTGAEEEMYSLDYLPSRNT